MKQIEVQNHVYATIQNFVHKVDDELKPIGTNEPNAPVVPASEITCPLNQKDDGNYVYQSNSRKNS